MKALQHRVLLGTEGRNVAHTLRTAHCLPGQEVDRARYGVHSRVKHPVQSRFDEFSFLFAEPTHMQTGAMTACAVNIMERMDRGRYFCLWYEEQQLGTVEDFFPLSTRSVVPNVSFLRSPRCFFVSAYLKSIRLVERIFSPGESASVSTIAGSSEKNVPERSEHRPIS